MSASSLLPILYGSGSNVSAEAVDSELSMSVIQAVCMLSPRVPEETRQQAQASLDDFKTNNRDAWRICLSIYLKSAGNQGYFQRYFVALNIQEDDYFVLINVLSLLESVVRFRYNLLAEEDQAAIKLVLYTWIAQHYAFVEDKFPAFLRTKVAWILVLIFRFDFPAPWRSFFADFFYLSPISATCMTIGGMTPPVMPASLPPLEGLAPVSVVEGHPPIATTLASSQSAQLAHIDMLVRILLAIDHEVVNRDVQRAETELAQNTLIKDAMREDCVPTIAELFYRIFVDDFFQQHTQIVSSCLQVMASYIPWIDISLVISPRFLDVFFRFLLVPQLRENACMCLSRIIVKGMDAPAKISLIQSINIVSVIHTISSHIAAGIASGQTSEDQESDFLSSLSALVNTIGTQLLVSLGKCQTGAVLLTDDPSTIPQAVQLCLALVQETLPLLFAFLGHEDNDVSMAVSPFAAEFIRMNLADPSSKQLSDLLSIVIHKMRYDPDHDFDDETGEDQLAMQEIRKTMKSLFDHVRALNPEIVLTYVHDYVLHTTNNWGSLSFVDVEIALKLMFLVGESQASALFQDASQGASAANAPGASSGSGAGTSGAGGSSGLSAPPTPGGTGAGAGAGAGADASLLSSSPSASSAALAGGSRSSVSGPAGKQGHRGGKQHNSASQSSSADSISRVSAQIISPALLQQYNDAFHSMMTAVITSNVSSYPHPVVVMEFFEVVLRYSRYFEVAPQQIPGVLQVFLDGRGIRQQHVARRGRATYLFSRFVSQLRRLMVDYVDAILSSMQDLLVIQPDPVFASSQPASPVASRRASAVGAGGSGTDRDGTGAGGRGGRSNGGGSGDGIGGGGGSSGGGGSGGNSSTTFSTGSSAISAEQHAFDDQLYFFETVSSLIAIDAHAPKRQQDLLRLFLDPLLNQFNEVVDRELYLTDTLEVPTYAIFCTQVIQAATYLTKGYTNDNHVRMAALGELLLQALETFCKVFKIPHCQERLRAALRQYIHRMVVCLGDDLIPFISSLASSFLAGAQYKDLGDFAQLLGQFATKYKTKIAELLNESLLVVMSRFFEALNAPIDANDQESKRERQLLRRRYFALLNTLLQNELAPVFSSPSNIQLFIPIFSSVVQGASDSSDVDSQKVCFTILANAIDIWAASTDGSGVAEAFNELLYQQIVPACFTVLLSSGLSFQDAQTAVLLQNIAATLRSATLKCGQEFLNYLGTIYLPTLPLTYEFQQGLLQTLLQSYQVNIAEFVRNFKSLIMLLDPKRR